MAINEQILTGKKYRVLADESSGLWNRISFWNKASDTEMNNGTTVETAVSNLNNEVSTINSNLTASDDLTFRFATDGEGNYGYLKADDSFVPFKKNSIELIGTYSGNKTIDVSEYINDEDTTNNFIIEYIGVNWANNGTPKSIVNEAYSAAIDTASINKTLSDSNLIISGAQIVGGWSAGVDQGTSDYNRVSTDVIYNVYHI